MWVVTTVATKAPPSRRTPNRTLLVVAGAGALLLYLTR